jgi:hypothetical protein
MPALGMHPVKDVVSFTWLDPRPCVNPWEYEYPWRRVSDAVREVWGEHGREATRSP